MLKHTQEKSSKISEMKEKERKEMMNSRVTSTAPKDATGETDQRKHCVERRNEKGGHAFPLCDLWCLFCRSGDG